MDPLHDYFVSKSSSFPAGIEAGTKIYAIASGTNKNKGLLGIWIADAKPVICPATMAELTPFSKAAKPRRATKQWRVAAHCLNHIRGNTLEDIKETDVAPLLGRMPPCALTHQQIEELEAIAETHLESSVVPIAPGNRVFTVIDDKEMDDFIDSLTAW